VARVTGFSESTLRYYERIGLIDPAPRVASSSHRRYAAETVDTLEALACLRSTGMGSSAGRCESIALVIPQFRSAPRPTTQAYY
jgi:hypothetical protein